MTMLQPVPRRPNLYDLRPFLSAAHAALRVARDELRDAAARHAGQDPHAALALAQLAAAVDAVAAKLPPKWSIVFTPDRWLFDADDLHGRLTATRFGLWRLCSAADRNRAKPPAPDALIVHPEDIELFSRAPRDDGARWTVPEDIAELRELALVPGSAAHWRRAAVVTTFEEWSRDLHASLDASGIGTLSEANVEMTRVLDAICSAALAVPASMMPGVKAKARLAIRALVEEDDASDDLPALARARAAELGADNLDALTWSALGDLLGAS